MAGAYPFPSSVSGLRLTASITTGHGDTGHDGGVGQEIGFSLVFSYPSTH
jgi:hypothetical protein